MSLRQKWENYWYHYKMHTIAVIVIAALVIVGFKSCMDKKVTDLHMAYMSTQYISDETINAIETSFNENGLIKDIDGDGLNNFYMDTVVHNFDVDSNADQATMQKIQTILYAGQHTLVLAHQYALEDYDGCFEDLTDKVREGDKVFESPSEGFATGISIEGNKYLESLGIKTENMYVAMRRQSEKEAEKNENAEFFASAYEVMDYILSKN